MRLHRADPSSPGLRRIRRGRGFEYRDPSDRRIVDVVELSRIRALAIPPAWTDVWINPDADGHIQATGVDEAGRRQYRYHEHWQRRSSRAKFDRMLELAAALPAARRSVTRDLRSDQSPRATVLAAGFRMLDTAYLRVGSETYAQQHGSIGLTTLRGSHVRVAGSVIELRFRGKGGLPWETDIDDADLAPIVEELRGRGLRRHLLAWPGPSGWRTVRASDINDDVRARTGGAFTAKDFRTIHGTGVAATTLAQIGVVETATAQKRAINDAVRAAADALGNTPAVARSSYIDPRIFERYTAGRVIRLGPNPESQLLELLE